MCSCFCRTAPWLQPSQPLLPAPPPLLPLPLGEKPSLRACQFCLCRRGDFSPFVVMQNAVLATALTLKTGTDKSGTNPGSPAPEVAFPSAQPKTLRKI
ncbi:hypothetical protein DPEC_G00171910 [Dallia pectoralis]|uniref:Uncharacterized protein n=1 Tax=Dallia pectoralis TaxID=75939 RepID=A0ACC2GDD8_DALPE|nr:hypothetical protein DPEC_G00171910 [Dallia pectoralis]